MKKIEKTEKRPIISWLRSHGALDIKWLICFLPTFRPSGLFDCKASGQISIHLSIQYNSAKYLRRQNSVF